MGKAGRPLGAKSRPQFKDYVTEEELKELVNIAKEQAKTKPELLKFVLEQIYGKASQPIEGPGEGGEFIIRWPKS